jgi:hypothetical protein
VNHHRLLDVHDIRPESLPPSALTGLSKTDWLFAMLDGQIIRGPHTRRAWRAEVVSIVTERGATWVQIGPAQQPARAVVLRMGSDQPADEAIEALGAWTDIPEECRPNRIDLLSDTL